VIRSSINISIFFLCFTSHLIQTADIGSDTAVTRFDSTITVNDGDRIAGFAALANGFQFIDVTVAATFDSFFEVSGDVSINRGNLILNRDLILRNPSAIDTLGNIVGRFHALELSSSSTCVPAGDSCDLGLTGTASVSTFLQSSADWSFDNQFIASAGVEFGGADALEVLKFTGSGDPIFQDSFTSGSIIIGFSTRWHPSAYILAFGNGTFFGGVIDQVQIFEFEPIGGTLSVVAGSSVSLGGIGVNATALSWHPTGSFLAVGSNLDSQEIAIYAFDTSLTTLTTTPLVTIDLSPNQDVSVGALDWDTSGTYLAVGLTTVVGNSDELRVYEFDINNSTLIQNASTFFDRTVSGVDWNKTDSSIFAVGLTPAGPTVDLLRLFQHDSGSGTGAGDGSLIQKNSRSDISVAVQNVDWSPDGNCLAVGTALDASNQEFRIYPYDNSTISLANPDTFEIGLSVNSVRWSPSGQFMAVGTSPGAVTPCELQVYTNFGTFLGCSVFSNINLTLNCNTEFKECIEFEGQSVINGQGHCLTLAPTTTFFIGEGATLLIKDITITNVNTGKLQCLDSLSTISFKDVTLILDDDFTFTQGHFDVIGDLRIVGDGHKFTYQADQVSSLSPEVTMLLDFGVTFSYDPQMPINNLLQLTDKSAALFLNGATLHSTSTGLQLEKGRLIADKTSFLSSDATSFDEAFTFGDGIVSADNVTIQIAPGATLEFKQGYFSHDDA